MIKMTILKKYWKKYKRYKDLKLFYIALRRKLRIGDERKWLVIWGYYVTRKRFPNLKQPSNLSEYIYADILYKRIEKYADLADKVLVRNYVKAKGLGDILTQLYGVWNKPSEIELNELPKKFVIKTNNACKQNIVCTNKSGMNLDEIRMKFNDWMGSKYNILETHYSLIKPMILAEEFIDDGTGDLPQDYKFMCFNGEPFIVVVCAERDIKTLDPKIYLFDKDWNYLPNYSTDVYSDWAKIRKPRNFDKMLEYASVLSADFPFVRVDLYDTGSRIYFGELTFSPAIGSLYYFTDRAIKEMFIKLNQDTSLSETEMKR